MEITLRLFKTVVTVFVLFSDDCVFMIIASPASRDLTISRFSIILPIYAEVCQCHVNKIITKFLEIFRFAHPANSAGLHRPNFLPL